MQQVGDKGVGLQLPVLPSHCLLGSGHCSALDVLHRTGDSWVVASCDLFIFSLLLRTSCYL